MIKADTTKIKSTASEIRSEAADYKTSFDDLFTVIDSLKATWTSEDGNAYIAKINTYREEFEGLYSKLSTSAEALEQAATAYEITVKNNTIA